MRGTPEERFWARVDKSAGPEACWWWRGALSVWGRGLFNIKHGQMVQAHRYAWTLLRGEIPAGRHVLHTCDNGACVNPAHLYLGDHFDNMRDRKERGRWAGGRGHINPLRPRKKGTILV